MPGDSMRRRGFRRFTIFRFIALRFAVVGSISTAVDLGIFATLTGLASLQPDRGCGHLLLLRFGRHGFSFQLCSTRCAWPSRRTTSSSLVCSKSR